MARRPAAAPEWFDLANYDSLRDATLEDWLVELTSRKTSFSILSQARIEDRHRRGKGYAYSLDLWERVRRYGSLTGRHRDVVRQMRERFELAGLPFSRDEVNAILHDHHSRRAEWLSEHGETEEPGSVVTRLTKGEVLLRFLLAGWAGELTQEIEDDEPWKGVNSPMPMDAIGALRSDRSGFLKVDLSAPDALIRAEFDLWLAAQRGKQLSAGAPLPKLVCESDFADWRQFQILPFLDLTFAREHEGIRLSQEQIGALLFPEEIDVSVAERVRKVTRPKALAIFTDSFLDGMHHQHAHALAERNE